jgi:CheY-like chemotaxis protein
MSRGLRGRPATPGVLPARDRRPFARAARPPANLDLLLTDVVMPVMNRRQLAERLATIRPATRVLDMSGYTEDALGRSGVPDGSSRLVHKPFTPEALLERVREVLDG